MKRLLSRISLLGLAALALTLGACDLTELNDNPNQPSEATTPSLLTNAQVTIAQNYWGGFTLGRFGNLYAQYWTQNQYTSEDRYAFPSQRSGVVNTMWEDYYFALNDLQEIIRINRQRPEAALAYGANENQIAIAKIMQAWTFQVITDIWGPAPFTDALQGRSAGEFSPEYASQEEIYLGILDSLTAASQMIDPEGTALASGDLVYGGDMDQWKEFANSLKMRVAIRLADVLPGVAQQAITEALEAGVFESNADNALIDFNLAPPYQNPIYENYEVDGRDDWAVTETLLGLMNENEDPRRPAYAVETENGFVGYTYGLDGSAAFARYAERDTNPFSRPSLRVREADAPAILMLYDEVLFILAEAAQRWGIGEQSAEQYYEEAIAASMTYWGVDDEAAIDAYIGRVPYNAANWEEVLGTQKWIALYMQGVQGWSEWRRLDFGVLQPPAGGSIPELDTDVAVRLTYPLDEANLNDENLQAAIEMLGGEDAQDVRVWWDVE